MILVIVILLFLFIIALLLILSILLWRSLQKEKETSGEDEKILDTLERSLSAGDIDQKEYDGMRRTIESSPPAGPRDKDK